MLLTVGNSPACSFLSWRLAVGNLPVITVGSQVIKKNKDTIFWKSKKYADHEFKPILNYSELSQLKTIQNNLDIVLISASTLDELVEISNKLKLIVSKSAVILIDSTYASGLEKVILRMLPNNVVLSVFSEAKVKNVEYDTRIVNQHLGNKVTTMIGTSISTPPKHIEEALKGNSLAGKKLTEMVSILQSNGVHPCTLVQKGVKPSINSFIWKQVASFIAFDVLSLIYGELNLKNKGLLIVKKVFQDILSLAVVACPGEIPNKKETAKVDQLFNEIITEYNQLHSQYKVEPKVKSTPIYNHELLDIPLCIYNFSNNLENQIKLSLDQCLNISSELNIVVPYIESISTFYLEIENIQSKKIFDWMGKTLYQPSVPLNMPKPEVVHPVNNGFNNSNTSLFNTIQHGSSTPMTPMSNTVPPGYTYYADQNIMLPNGIKPEMLQYPPPQYSNMLQEISRSFSPHIMQHTEHPRFKDLPAEEINGKKIHFRQIKSLAYPSAKGSISPEALAQAQKHIYQYANLNGIFETINNRYGASDSLDIFKLSSGLREDYDDDAVSHIDNNKYSNTSDSMAFNRNDTNVQTSSDNHNEDNENGKVNSGSSNNNKDMADADQNIK